MINTDLLIEIAGMHYESGLTQEEISKRIGVSRPYISRLLKRAQDEGIVEIVVHRAVRVNSQLQQQLIERFGLTDARVLAAPTDNSDAAHTSQLMGQLGASFLNAIIQDGMTIGVSFGSSVYQVVSAMPARRDLPNVKITQMVGGQHAFGIETDGPMVAELLATRLGARFYRLHAPLFLDSRDARDSLIASPTIADVLEITRSAHIALVSIGAWSNYVPSLQRLNYNIRTKEIEQLEKAGVVGDILVRSLNRKGEVIPSTIIDRIVGIDPSDLQQMRWVIGIAWQEEKVEAILATLRGKYLNVLITNEHCARAILEREG